MRSSVDAQLTRLLSKLEALTGPVVEPPASSASNATVNLPSDALAPCPIDQTRRSDAGDLSRSRPGPGEWFCRPPPGRTQRTTTPMPPRRRHRLANGSSIFKPIFARSSSNRVTRIKSMNNQKSRLMREGRRDRIMPRGHQLLRRSSKCLPDRCSGSGVIEGK